jgi:hypothetical protein
MFDTRHDRLALALVALAGVLLASSAMQPEHGRVILLTAQDLMDRRPGNKTDLADWVMAAALSAQEQAQADQTVIKPASSVGLPTDVASTPLCRASGPAFSAGLGCPGFISLGQWHLTSLPPPVA